MDEEKISYSNMEPNQRERQRQPATRPVSSKYATLIQNNSKGITKEYPKVHEELGYRREHSKEHYGNQKFPVQGQNYYVIPIEEKMNSEKIENELAPSLGYQPKEIYHPRYQNEENYNFPIKTTVSNVQNTSIYGDKELEIKTSKIITFVNASFAESCKLPLNNIWNHLIIKRVLF